MVRFITGDIFAQDAQALVNPVNCVGVMGKGLALQFKQKFPLNFNLYRRACMKDELQPGRILTCSTGRETPSVIINLPTKRHWRDSSRMEDIEAGLDALAREIRARRLSSVAIPALGAGLGGLEWREVRKAIEEKLSGLEGTEITVLEPLEGRTGTNRAGRASG
jgi:O-acetyl-ADP-ribose deacetylase (regulator of RNase III)